MNKTKFICGNLYGLIILLFMSIGVVSLSFTLENAIYDYVSIVLLIILSIWICLFGIWLDENGYTPEPCERDKEIMRRFGHSEP